MHDLNGNVYEWTASLYRPYGYDAADGREAVDADGGRVLRGGSWYTGPTQVRCAYRRGTSRGTGTATTGFALPGPLSKLLSCVHCPLSPENKVK